MAIYHYYIIGTYWFSASSLQVRLVRGPAHTCETAAAINARLLPEMMQKRGRISNTWHVIGICKSHKTACHIREEIRWALMASINSRIGSPLCVTPPFLSLPICTLRLERWPEDSHNTHERLPAKQSSFSLASQRLPCVPTALFCSPRLAV
ncbi:uncharacterized protein TrAtP1_006902 [Trichoderma atroviride]|uniref:uncharacterized protein n=1 Tax=Hypocrea atroviridis TaxID=63577 RepID=UPI00332D29BE|nr:hypothetical protein TrAtP1_006902 [Trichoderma atroviride]